MTRLLLFLLTALALVYPRLPDHAELDIADYAVATPALRPLASDCRLPCFGIARRGPASWFNAGPGWYAAVPGYIDGTVMTAVVCTFPDGKANCLSLPIVSSCQCFRHTPAEKVVDLSPAAFAQFAPLSRGVVMVTVTVLR